MLAIDGISSAIVDVKEIAGVQQLCGYYISKKTISQEEIKDWLRKSLTDFMIPAELIRMEKFPLTNNGKVNRKALPVPETVHQEQYVAPSGEVEQNICNVFSDILNTGKPGVLDNFFALGGSSITAIKAIIRITNLGYGIQYGDFFKLKTPRAIANFLSDGNQSGKKGEVANLEDLSDYDYTAINKLLEAKKPDLWNNYTEFEPGDVLLTGSTGYLGIHVLKELLDKEKGKIYCMVRPKGSITPEKRLKTLLTYYFSEPFDEFFQSRIIPVNGDITDISTLKLMKGKGIGTVINCAATVKHFDAGNEINKINFDGVCNLLDYCREEGSRLVHVSTLSTAGIIETDKLGRDTVIDESKLYIGQKIDNMYVLSKFKAERVVLQAMSEGLDGKIMRVGNLMGRFTDGEFQVNFRSNAFVNALKAYKVLGMFPLSQLTNPVEISPIDFVATAIVALSKAPSGIHIAHSYNNYRLNMANVIYAMKLHGFDIELVSDGVFDGHFQEVLKYPKKSEYLSGLLHYRIGENYTEMPDNNNYTTTLLYKSGFRWPVPGEDYSIRLIKVLDGMGFFDEDMGN
jgi:thioester reductase-like protein